MMNIFVSEGLVQYPDRFYCTKNSPCTFYDMWGFGDLDGLKPISDFYSITAAEYAEQQTNPRTQYYDTNTGMLADYVAPVIPVPLSVQAQSLLQTQQTYVMQTYTLYGDVTPPDWLSYLKALRAIANGTDTTSIVLPTEPAK